MVETVDEEMRPEAVRDIEEQHRLHAVPRPVPSVREDPTAPHAGGHGDVFWAIANRRSVTRFLPRPLEMDKILQIVQAGALAPSSGNIQNWSFIVVTDLERIRGLYHHTLDQEPFLSATAAVIVVGDEAHADRLYGLRGKRLYTVQNCAAAMQNMLLAATALGVGSVWIGAFDEDRIGSLFGIPSTSRPQSIILLGYPEIVPEPKERKPLDTLVYFNSFGNRVQRPHLVLYDWATEWRLQAQKAKAHLQHMAARARAKGPDRHVRLSEARESASQAMLRAKGRMRSVIEGLKKEEYRSGR